MDGPGVLLMNGSSHIVSLMLSREEFVIIERSVPADTQSVIVTYDESGFGGGSSRASARRRRKS